MNIFLKTKRKIFRKEIVKAAGCISVIAACVCLLVFSLISPDSYFRASGRSGGGELQPPVMIIIVLSSVMAVAFLVFFLKIITRLIGNKDYEKAIMVAESIGGVDAVDEMLGELWENAYSKGVRLRYNSKALFYSDSSSFALFDGEKISSVRKVKADRAAEQTFGVMIFGFILWKTFYKDKSVVSVSSGGKTVHILAENDRAVELECELSKLYKVGMAKKES